MSNLTYPLDTVGNAATNLVSNEPHNLTPTNSSPYRVLIPYAAPFHTTNLQVVHLSAQGVETPLTENVDFQLSLRYIGASDALGKSVYGGIRILNPMLEGMVYITYQTLGDKWIADRDYALERLTESVYNDRLTVWDNLTNVQDLFPPQPHTVPLDSIYGQKELIDALMKIVGAIANPDSTQTPFSLHMFDTNDPHHTLPRVLDAIENQAIWRDTVRRVVGAISLDKLATVSQLAGVVNNASTAGGILTLGVLLGVLGTRDTQLVSTLRNTLKPSKAEVDSVSDSEGLVTLTQLKQILVSYQKKA